MRPHARIFRGQTLSVKPSERQELASHAQNNVGDSACEMELQHERALKCSRENRDIQERVSDW